MKRFLATVLCVILVLSLFAACGSAPAAPAANDGPQQPDANQPDAPVGNELPDAEITIYFMGASVAAGGDADVIAAANDRLAQLGLNITVRPIWGDWNAGEPIQMALDTGDTGVDIVFTCSWAAFYAPNARRGNFVRLDDPNNNLLEQFGQDMKASVPASLWDGFTADGPLGRGIYGAPGYKDYAQLYAWDVNVELLEELGFSYDAFDWSYATIFDPMFLEAMEAFQEKFGPTQFPLVYETEGFARALSNSDFDLTGLDGVFHFSFDPNNPSLPARPAAVPNLENEDYLRVLERLHYFYSRGLVDPRSAIQTESSAAVNEARTSGNYLFTNITYAYGHTQAATAQRGRDTRFPPMSAPLMSTVSVTGSGYAISVYSRQQEQAMRFLNAWYTDSELATILTFGVEDTHFIRNADGTVTLDQDLRNNQFNTWINGTGNVFILPPQDVQGPDFYDRFKAYNEAGVPTALLGFTFDDSAVINEMAALRNVVAEFQSTVSTGAVDPAVQGAEFLNRLRQNGLDTVQAELNAQIDAFFS